MSITADQDTCLSDRPIKVVLNAFADHADLVTPECEICWTSAVGVVTQESPDDIEQRIVVCRGCAIDVMAEATLRHRDGHTFTPPEFAFLDLDAFRPHASKLPHLTEVSA